MSATINNQVTQDYHEQKIPVTIFRDAFEASRAIAGEIAALMRLKQAEGKSCVLGLATGSTPKTVYKELVRMHREEGLSFGNVVSFNLDEYYPIRPDVAQSYVRFMHHHLFDHVDIPKDNVHIPDGTVPRDKVPEFCANYEEAIKRAGGIDLQLLGIGRTGHIGFNEPGTSRHSRTRLISLDHITIKDAASDFFGEENVPSKAITMGVGTIMESKRVLLMAWGEGKASVIREAVEGEVTESVPATYLQMHDNAVAILDEASSAELTRIKTPWLLKECEWDEDLITRAVIWLSQFTGKAVLKLTNRDYSEHGMGDIITEFDTAYNINIRVFNRLQHTITGWPGGKPDADDSQRPERAHPAQKRSIVFSPHPDDDVISMGGTLIRLHEQGHDVHVAYQTSGNIAVFDDEVVRFADFVRDADILYGFDEETTERRFREIRQMLKEKEPTEMDPEIVRDMKAMIRRGEARAACRFIGLPDANVHFLNMPFYETGEIEKKDISEEDVRIIIDFMRSIKPHQIFAAGDLSDPHGTHRVCLQAILQALEICKQDQWYANCYVWLYRGAWQEWGIHEIHMAVPVSPEELTKKRRAIFKHQSQKDRPLFPGPDPREFWQRAEDRNRATAQAYDQLGLAEYEAIEAFRRLQL